MIISEDDPSSKRRAITGNIKLQHFNAMTASKQPDGKASIKIIVNDDQQVATYILTYSMEQSPS